MKHLYRRQVLWHTEGSQALTEAVLRQMSTSIAIRRDTQTLVFWGFLSRHIKALDMWEEGEYYCCLFREQVLVIHLYFVSFNSAVIHKKLK